MIIFDLDQESLRQLNLTLHKLPDRGNEAVRILNPKGRHNVAVGLKVAADIEIDGPVGYYCAGMNMAARVTIHGHAGQGVAENMMSGLVRVRGNAAQAAGATGRGGLLVIEGDAGARCGISMKGINIVVCGSIGHMSAFMAQAGTLVVCGDAGADLGDSIYEAKLFVAGDVASLGADCEEREMTPEDAALVEGLLAKTGLVAPARSFRYFGSARRLYNFNVDHAASY